VQPVRGGVCGFQLHLDPNPPSSVFLINIKLTTRAVRIQYPSFNFSIPKYEKLTVERHLLPPVRKAMVACTRCRDLKKEDESSPRLACEITPDQFLNKEDWKHCSICSFVVEGILSFEDNTWTLRHDVSRVFLYALSNTGDSLTVELYFRSERPKLVLEFFHTKGE